jgi:hypothetical protein
MVKAKQILKFLTGARKINTFEATGASSVVTTEITSNLGTLPVQVSSATQMGVITTGNNRIDIWDATTKQKIVAAGQYEVYGRLTEATGVYTLTYYYVDNAGVETAYTMSTTDIDFIYLYQYDFKNLPSDFAVVIPESYVAQDIKNYNGIFTVENITVSGTNTLSNLANTPFNVNTVTLSVNGIQLRTNTDFTVSGSTITLVPSAIGYDVETTDLVDAIYFRA